MKNLLFSLGILIILLLAADALGLAGNHAVFSKPVTRGIYQVISGLSAALALILAAWCLKIGMDTEARKDRRLRFFSLGLAGVLVICVTAVTFRHAVLVRATGRAPEDHIPSMILLIGVISGLALLFIGRGQYRRAGWIYLCIVPVLLFVSFYSGLQVDFQVITDQRAQSIGQALEKYFQENGNYPAELKALTPRYLSMILGPLTGRGQVWCYQANQAGYRLGYAFFQRYYDWEDGTPFYEPYFAIRTPQTGGRSPEGRWVCDEELDLLKSHGGL